MASHNPLLSQLTSKPLLVSAEHTARFEANVRAAEQHADFGKLTASASSNDDGEFFWYPDDDWRASLQPYVVKNGVLRIPVKGVLINGFPFSFGGWVTGYEYIQAAYERGVEDGNVRAIALMIDSPGGMVAGNFDLVDRFFAGRGSKPLQAFCEDAYSAAYSIASVADRITVTRSGGVGSIGVVTMHVDQSQRLEDSGLKVTFIHYGKHKVDGNSCEPLADDVKARIQSTIDALGEEFVGIVARNRGLDPSSVRETEAACFTADEGIAKGLADAKETLNVALAVFTKQQNSEGGPAMANSQEQAQPTAFQQSDIDAATAAGTKAGADAERARIKGILGLESAKDFQAQAVNIALTTSMTVEEAGALLKTFEAGAKPEGNKPNAMFDKAMEQGNPNIGPDGSGSDEDDSGGIDLLAAHDKLTGRRTK